MIRRCNAIPCVMVAFSLLAVRFADGQDWSRFRGPNGSGVVEAAGLPVEFGPEQSVVWKVAVPFGRSSPVLGEDALFLTAVEEESLVTLCYDLGDGSLRWRRDKARSRAADMYPDNDSASASPVTDGENVYAFFQELGLVSYDARGNERWTRPLGPFRSFYGVAASPIVVGDLVVQLCDQKLGSFLVAVDAASGEVRWRSERVGMIESWTTPVVFEPEPEDAEILVFGSQKVHCYSASTGENLWERGGFGITPIASPVVQGDVLFLSAPNQAEQPMPPFSQLLGMDTDGDGKLSPAEVKGSQLADHFGFMDTDGDGFLVTAEWDAMLDTASNRDHGAVALDLTQADDPDSEAAELWRYKRAPSNIATPLFYRDVLYLVKDGGIVTTLDAMTGEVHHQARLPDAGGEHFPSPVAADGKIFVAGNAGTVTVLEAGPGAEVIATNDLGEEIRATPAIGNGRLYVRTQTALYCFGESPREQRK